MGSITQAPKAPASSASQVVYYTPASSYSSSGASDIDSTPPTGTTDAQKSEQRTESLLRRERGRLGTVLTGFRGLLGLSESDGGQRKTLLGE